MLQENYTIQEIAEMQKNGKFTIELPAGVDKEIIDNFIGTLLPHYVYIDRHGIKIDSSFKNTAELSIKVIDNSETIVSESKMVGNISGTRMSPETLLGSSNTTSLYISYIDDVVNINITMVNRGHGVRTDFVVVNQLDASTSSKLTNQHYLLSQICDGLLVKRLD